MFCENKNVKNDRKHNYKEFMNVLNACAHNIYKIYNALGHKKKSQLRQV